MFGAAAPTEAKNMAAEEGSDEEEASNNVDIYFEPIVSLPEVPSNTLLIFMVKIFKISALEDII